MAVPGSSTTATGVTFTFTANEPGVTFNCSLDTAPFAACTSPVTVSGLALGNHTFRVRARDAAGNFENPGATPRVDRRCAAAGLRVGDDAERHGRRLARGVGTRSNKGVDSTLKVTSKSSNQNIRALIRFGLPATVPAGCVVQSATLQMFSNAAVNGRTLRASPYRGVQRDGGQWSNQPGATGRCDDDVGDRLADVERHGAAPGGVRDYELYGFLIRDATEARGATSSSCIAGRRPPSIPCLSALRACVDLDHHDHHHHDATSTTSDDDHDDGAADDHHVDHDDDDVRSVDDHDHATTHADDDDHDDAAADDHDDPPPACTTSTVTVGSNTDTWLLQSSPGSNHATDSRSRSTRSPATTPGCSCASTCRRSRRAAGSPTSAAHVGRRVGGGRTLQAIRVNAAWTEGGVNWGNQPATTGAAATTLGHGWRQWSVTARSSRCTPAPTTAS